MAEDGIVFVVGNVVFLLENREEPSCRRSWSSGLSCCFVLLMVSAASITVRACLQFDNTRTFLVIYTYVILQRGG